MLGSALTNLARITNASLEAEPSGLGQRHWTGLLVTHDQKGLLETAMEQITSNLIGYLKWDMNKSERT